MRDPAEILIDASNLRVGGGVQVASSLIEHILASEPRAGKNFTFWTSPEVFNSLSGAATGRVFQVDSQKLFRKLPRRGDFDVIFTVFGPAYRTRRAQVEITGFADGTSLYPTPWVSEGLMARGKRGLRARLSRSWATRSDLVVVETTEIRNRLASYWGIDTTRMLVVPNSAHQIFSTNSLGPPAVQWNPTPPVNLLYVASAYPHKNHVFLGSLASILEQQYNLSVRFILTVTGEEWSQLDGLTRRYARNVGRVAVTELPDLYRECDGVIFPSLLEAFSATPLEALATAKPLFASDRAFVSDVCMDAATYFDPCDPHAAAQVIAAAIDDSEVLVAKAIRGLELISTLPTAEVRARNILAILDSAIARRAEVTSR